jgi:hypothetical protein
MFDVVTEQPVNFRGLWFFRTVQATAGSAIRYLGKVSPPAAANTYSHIERCEFTSHYVAIDFEAAAIWIVRDSGFSTNVAAAILSKNTVNADQGDSVVEGSTFDAGTTNVNSVAIQAPSSGGLRIVGNKFLRGAAHLFIMPGPGIETNDLLVVGNSMEHAAQWAIMLQPQPSGVTTAWNAIVVDGNQIDAHDSFIAGGGVLVDGSSITRVVISNNVIHVGSTQAAVAVAGAPHVTVVGNEITGSGSAGPTSSGISVNAAPYLMLSGNSVKQVSVGMVVNAGAVLLTAGALVSGNNVREVGTPIALLGGQSTMLDHATGLSIVQLPPTAANGSRAWCSNCQGADANWGVAGAPFRPCLGGGNGAWAYRIAGAWRCA